MGLESWKSKVMYLVLIDRFYNGDKTNDDFKEGEFDPAHDDYFHGGDLQGILQKLPFLKELGVYALWITPPVYNQWINPYIAIRGYHGYWAYDFTRVDPHFGTVEDYRNLVKEAHRLGIRVIQDIVVNHTGNYFTVEEKGYDPEHPEKNWRELPEAYPPKDRPKAPNDPVFRMNDPNDPEHRAAGVYNFTPNIVDFKDRSQTLTWSMGDLDDINLLSPLAAKRMREIYRYWIEEVGVDGFRVDTVFYTPEDFYEGFLHAEDAQDPGVKPFARGLGIKDFFVFGEVWSYEYPAINRYVREVRKARLDSAIDMPLHEALTQVFFRKSPTERLRPALRAKRCNRNLWVNFLDNHDTERVAATAGRAAAEQALVALFTLPGIPCVYYGTEAGLKGARQDMFSEEHFCEKSRHHSFLKELIAFRKKHPAFWSGKLSVDRTSFGPGVLAYSLDWGGKTYRMVFNTSTDRMICDLGLGKKHEVLLSSEKLQGACGALILAPESYYVLRELPVEAESSPGLGLSMQPLESGAVRGVVDIAFQPGDSQEVSLLSNDNYDRRLRIPNPASGSFKLHTAELGNGRHRIALLAKTPSGELLLSAESLVAVRNRYKLVRRVAVPEENKGGLGQKVKPPADPSYGSQLSMESVAVYSSGRDLRLRIRMSEVSDAWNPPNGYDHVYFSVFFDFPDQRGKRSLPKLGYEPAGFDFNAGFLLFGWGARSFGAEDSSPDAYGRPLLGEVTQAADKKGRSVTFTFSSKFFESLTSMSGVKIFVSTWDGYLGEFRRISDKKEDWEFYSLDCRSVAELPKVYDHVVIHI